MTDDNEAQEPNATAPNAPESIEGTPAPDVAAGTALEPAAPGPVETATSFVQPLNARQLRFAEEYPKDLNGTLAAGRAGYKGGEKALGVQAVRLLADARVQAIISVKLAERSKRVEIEADDVLREFWAIARADPRELIEYRIAPCRFCWGDRHEYQRTPEEARADRREWERLNEADDPERIRRWRELGGEEFDTKGGVGYDRRKRPNPKCPECFGEGVGYTVVKDQRSVSPAAARLLAGVKETKEGIEVKMHDPQVALDRVARHLGMFVDRVDHTTNGQPLPPGAINVTLIRPATRTEEPT
jgi:hypothetical protein